MENKSETGEEDARRRFDAIVRCGKGLELVCTAYSIRINSRMIEEIVLDRLDASVEPSKASKEKESPFRSPITPKAANLKWSPPQQRGFYSRDEYANEDVFTREGRYRRKSSIAAEEKIKKMIEEEEMAIRKEPYEKTIFESMFCGISKTRRQMARAEIEPSRPIDFDEDSEPLIRILQDKTNSPMKPSKTKTSPQVNTNFFTIDFPMLTVIKESKVEEAEEIEPVVYDTSRLHSKEKDINTKLNEGYKTVEIRRRTVIDLFTCPKTYFRRSDRKRQVYFDVNGKSAPHRRDSMVSSIYIEPECDCDEFEWNKDKEVVDVVQRIDLGSERTVDDFLFKKIESGIQS